MRKATIDRLKDVIRDPNCASMNLGTVKGFLGELLVKEKLADEGVSINHKGNQSGFDLEFKDVKIDVKFSTLKEEFKHFPKFWDCALKHKNKQKISCTHFVCVAVDENLELITFYVIKSRHLKRFPKYLGKFKNVEHGFAVLPSTSKLPSDCPLELRKYFKKCDSLVREGIARETKADRVLSKFIVE